MYDQLVETLYKINTNISDRCFYQFFKKLKLDGTRPRLSSDALPVIRLRVFVIKFVTQLPPRRDSSSTIVFQPYRPLLLPFTFFSAKFRQIRIVIVCDIFSVKLLFNSFHIISNKHKVIEMFFLHPLRIRIILK